jgi:alkanesulfonate monooxygenase SsuD/methylene tetrahydromethanopterin reductase-like flavin-dependent oxidoreductase (luciferase family)
VEYGAHLPLADLGEGWTLAGLRRFARAAADLGYSHLCANDHLSFSRPWLDGLTALATVIDDSADMTLATTIALPVLRGPVSLAKSLSAIDLLCEGRLVAGVGPGSSATDYALAGLPFDQRWRRFDEAVAVLRRLLRGETGWTGAFYRTPDVPLQPRSPQPDGPPIWIASWGSPAGLRRVAGAADGWLASAYNISPVRFAQCLAQLGELDPGRSDPLPNALATAWCYTTESTAEAERVLADVLAPMVNRPVESLQHLPIGSAAACAERLSAFAQAGVQRIFLWPLRDGVRQLELFRERVVPLAALGR